ncbi:unnamed protein product [Parnassius apollo]|uniref:(apollo) hypothetical protein n=1 Tax=Parnassius apollo TaxID=110799 RepID=A0A8S3XUS0_PARAO|nr:unnamed protein product [Parnassius apollo]
MCFCLFLGVLISVKLYLVPHHRKKDLNTELVIMSLFDTVFIIDFVFTIVFIVAAHKKNHQLLRIYYKYGLVSFVMIFLLCLVLTGIDIFNNFYIIALKDIINIVTFGAAVIIFNLYLLSMIRSEILKLENNTQLAFVNHVTDPQRYVENGVNV